MKIVHICLGCFYIDNYSYQENMLPKYHKKLGYDVSIIASRLSFNASGLACLVEANEYINEFGIHVTRLDYLKGIEKVSKFLRLYDNLYNTLEKENPDILFIHGCQFLDIIYIKHYLKKHSHVKVFVDNHADFSNSATNWLSKNILHKFIWKKCAHIIEPYTEKFYGVLPARVDFLKNVYKIPEKKIEFLPMGADDEKFEQIENLEFKAQFRQKYNVKEDEFLVVTGGKIDNSKKQILLLMEAIKKLKNTNIKLIVFGSVVEELREQINLMSDGEKIQYIGWISSDESYNYFGMADLVVFPGRHSVFWEQVAGIGVPMLVKYWEGTTHIDIGGNCEFLYEDSVEEIKNKIEEIVLDEGKYTKMKNVAKKNGKLKFSYSKISEKSINCDI